MPDDVAAYLEAARARLAATRRARSFAAIDASQRDVGPLLELAGAIRKLAGQYRHESTTGYDASGLTADKLTDLLREKLLARRETRAAAPEVHAEHPVRGSSVRPSPDCGYVPRKPVAATELWWCMVCREFHEPREDGADG